MAEINGNSKNGLIGILIQGGAVGIAICSMWITWDIVTNHLNHNTEILTKLEAQISQSNNVMQQNCDAVKSLNETLKVFMAQLAKK